MYSRKSLLKTALMFLIGMALFMIGINIPGFPIWLFAFSVAVLSFIMAFYYQKILKSKTDQERRHRVQIFTFFGIISLLIGVGALIIPVPKPSPITELALIFGSLIGLLLGLIFLKNRTI